MIFYNIRQCFHAVGNGTLFTGQIQSNSSKAEYDWMYDCGSTSNATVIKAIGNLPRWFGVTHSKREIDMLVISHFDDDHVNGLEELLKHFRINRLVLPYTEWAQNVREVSVLGKKGTSPSVALFQLNPVRWLQINDLNHRVDQIILVHGSEGPTGIDSNLQRKPIEPSPNETRSSFDDPLPLLDEKEFMQGVDHEAIDAPFLGVDSSLSKTNIIIQKISHTIPLQTSDQTFEFVFYNIERSFKELGLVNEKAGKIYAKKSGILMSDVKKEIETLIFSLGLTGNISSLPINWRKKLKACYEKHFGHSGKAKNNISLCMYVGPRSELKNFHICVKRGVLVEKPSTFLTGDINLNPKVIDDMKAHFGDWRWKKMGTIQVPHHGSTHCWSPGNASHFMPAIFVQCATPTKNHPHVNVISDLKKSGCRVDYASRVKAVNYSYIVLALRHSTSFLWLQ